jgi:cyclase
MKRIRVIPVLLLKNNGLYKPHKFKNPKYIGDPINAVKIFNEKEVDEIIILDIDATAKKKEPNYKLIEEIASECFMPMAYGGGINELSQAKKLFKLGVEKVVLNYAAYSNPHLIHEIASQYGNQSVVCSIDVGKNWLGKYHTALINGTKSVKETPIDLAKKYVQHGAGELFITAIYKENTYSGYDIELIKSITENVFVPIIASGGASSIKDFTDVVSKGRASAVAVGSLFVFYGKEKGVLINFPSPEKLKTELFSKL